MTSPTPTVSTTRALDALYRKVIPARFTNDRQGNPMPCTACGSPLVMGQAHACTNGSGWDSYCASCAGSFPSLIEGLYRRVAAEVTALGDVPDAIVDQVRAATPSLQAVIASPTEFAPFGEARATLNQILSNVAEARMAERKVVLAGDPLYAGLALATTWCTGRMQQAAESISQQWERKGSISASQRSYAEAIAAAARKAESKSVKAVDWSPMLNDAIVASLIPDGYYATAAVAGSNDLTFVRIGTDDQARRVMRHIVGGHGEMPTGGLSWCQQVLDQIAAEGATVAGKRYATEVGKCFRCNRILTDQVSRDAGMGPVCRMG